MRVPLRRDADYLFTGAITDRQCFGRARGLLGIRSNTPDAIVIGRTDLSDTGEIGVYVPDTFPESEVELIIVL